MQKLAAAFGIAAILAAAGASAQEKPSVQFDNWLFLQHNADGSEQWQYRPRFFIPFSLAGGWRFTQRIDLPLSYTNQAGPDNPGGGWKSGLGDWFVEESFLSPEVSPNLKLSTSLRLVFPTGGSGPFGSDQYQWAPSVGALYSMPAHGLTLNPVARYFMSYHADRDGAGKVRRLDLYTTVTQELGNGWSLSFYNENPIGYNDVTNDWFVPADVLLIRRLGKSTELALGGAYGLVKDDPQYRYLLNGRLTVHF